MSTRLKDRIQAPNKHSDVLSDRKRRMYNFLVTNPVGVLSTVDPNGGPHGVVIFFVVDRQLTVKFLTRTKTKKYNNLLHNDHAMLTVFEPRNQTVVQLTGKATELSDSLEVNSVAGGIAGINLEMTGSSLPPILKLEAGDFTVFRIDPVQARMAVYLYSRPENGDYQYLFDSVESFD